MVVFERHSGKNIQIDILPVDEQDYRTITKSRFWFNWKEESAHDVFKLRIKGTDTILGLISLKSHNRELRIEIRLLAVSKENRGRNKTYEHIAGNLIAFACLRSIRMFGHWASVSLVPKTRLLQHYIEKYHMHPAGRHLLLDGEDIMKLINRYNHD